MNQKDWGKVRFFTKNENWGDPLMMERDLIFLLEELRGRFDCPFVIHCGYETSGHTQNSQHYRGNAVDFHVVGPQFLDAIDLIGRYIGPAPTGFDRDGVIGLGIYPHWRDPGFHLDLRGYRARWGAVSLGGKQVYVSFEEAARSAGAKKGG